MSLVLTLTTACSRQNPSDASKDQTTVKEEVVLTKDNFETYFNVNAYSDNYSESSRYNSLFGGTDYTCNCTLHISIEPNQDFEIKEPIEVKFKIIGTGSYSWYISGLKTEEVDYQHFATFSLPASGTLNKTYSCSISTYFTMASSMPTAYLNEVTGSILVAKR